MDYSRELSAAIRHYWTTRSDQNLRQGTVAGARDYGARTEVTGGKHLDGFCDLIKNVIVDAGLAENGIFCGKRTDLPGFFRPTKDWDVVVVVEGELLALMELKSQVGPSFGNNCNNRIEEALGSATDVWTAFREQTFRNSLRPWAGYLMLVEDCKGSQTPVRVAEAHFPIRKEFQDPTYRETQKGISYSRRYELFCRKLVLERLYDAACFITSTKEDGIKGEYSEPALDLSFKNFAASLTGQITEFIKRKS
jgi:Restriction endonuclease XhoI